MIKLVFRVSLYVIQRSLVVPIAKWEDRLLRGQINVPMSEW